MFSEYIVKSDDSAMHTRVIEIGVGIFVAIGFIAIIALAMQVSNLATFTQTDSYEIKAHFRNIGGLKVRAPITMAGVRVGRIKRIDLDSDTYDAVVTLSIFEEFNRLPLDTSASILTAGLLGEQYIGLEAGGEEGYLKDGDEITLTQSAVMLEQLIGQFMFGQASGEKK
uniref:Phospholipid/cholesterol/gamma-HCH transport system substrate-binding protein n=1 Tax=Candidatus Kentrum sp. SD TaxID=2126332 RepID=A0A450Z1K9_9GAMM|nr:MAG: phospholipid/cholesterol/gamma-HCH transport system substrate-binding protein [Candidatus Kentron sp. SD]VFK47629.1 MAG: phospholipid/cholesterol/gamma-HCH transport system substrate-binding protein [Candidatus Kentron sp. SD]VFK77712.1 MAG: phospholipid/cholesterol/gamma-HCH transport system substrate-binding protein [Candidatus Kentron sp. SD]